MFYKLKDNSNVSYERHGNSMPHQEFETILKLMTNNFLNLNELEIHLYR